MENKEEEISHTLCVKCAKIVTNTAKPPISNGQRVRFIYENSWRTGIVFAQHQEDETYSIYMDTGKSKEVLNFDIYDPFWQFSFINEVNYLNLWFL